MAVVIFISVMVKNEHLIIRISTEDKRQLESLSQIQDRPVSRIVREGYRDTINKYSKPLRLNQ